ncbi:hypothetical protein TESG_00206 [Trichophyton tonsurans CBS 112818]|uniref:Uncharacterized protein n=1 Tax=Trichophyton tonsurans (strain CBS 112818) TaxID=647933 RepID=F2RMT3_TRIT1|nr:hypothetical protein TESG_00206 [Trichophyton tonsurans CBS 112818]
MGVRYDERPHDCVLEEHPSQATKLLVEEDNGDFPCQADLTPSRPAISRSNNRSGSLIQDAVPASRIRSLACAQVERHIAPNRLSAEIQTVEAPDSQHQEKLMSGLSDRVLPGDPLAVDPVLLFPQKDTILDNNLHAIK